MSTLYVTRPGSTIRKASRRLVVVARDGSVQSVRLRELERLVVVGRVNITQPVLAALMEQGIETAFLAPSGRPIGRLVGADGKNVFLRVTQIQKYQDMAFRLDVARRLVDAKLYNARRVLQLGARLREGLDLGETLVDLKKARQKLDRQETMAAVMGVEGDGAARYFKAYGALFLGSLAFTVRSRRPPLDPVNSLLSLGYTLLATEATGAVAARGLDPYVGFMHELDYGRPSLALDLIEPFRHPVIDRFALTLLNKRVLKEDDFERLPNRGVLLRDEPRRKYFAYYDRLMTSTFQHGGAQTTWRGVLQAQVTDLARTILGGDPFEPFKMA